MELHCNENGDGVEEGSREGLTVSVSDRLIRQKQIDEVARGSSLHYCHIQSQKSVGFAIQCDK